MPIANKPLPKPLDQITPEDLPPSTAMLYAADRLPELQTREDELRALHTATAEGMGKDAIREALDQAAAGLEQRGGSGVSVLTSGRPARSAPRSAWVDYYAGGMTAVSETRQELLRVREDARQDQRADENVCALGDPSDTLTTAVAAALKTSGDDPVALVARLAGQAEEALAIQHALKLKADYLRARVGGMDPQDAATLVWTSAMPEVLHASSRGNGGLRGLQDAANAAALRGFLRSVQWVLPVPLMV